MIPCVLKSLYFHNQFHKTVSQSLMIFDSLECISQLFCRISFSLSFAHNYTVIMSFEDNHKD